MQIYKKKPRQLRYVNLLGAYEDNNGSVCKLLTYYILPHKIFFINEQQIDLHQL